MAKFKTCTAWVATLVPDLAGKLDPFVVETEEVDDELLEIFLGEIKRLSDELQAGVAQQDGEVVRMAAHSIKGMGGTMGLPEISVLGLEIETLAKADHLAAAQPLVNALGQWVGSLD